MAEVLVLIHFAGDAPPAPAFAEGILGASVWRRDEGADESLTVLRFPNAEAAARHLKTLVEASLDEPDDGRALPTVVHHLVIEEARGLALEEAAIGGYGVFARFVAEPGYGEVARSRAEEILPTFGQLPGFRGYAFGHREGFAEEAMVVLLWSEPPPRPGAEDAQAHVEIYRRVA